MMIRRFEEAARDGVPHGAGDCVLHEEELAGDQGYFGAKGGETADGSGEIGANGYVYVHCIRNRHSVC
jgi:hypothetical protein